MADGVYLLEARRTMNAGDRDGEPAIPIVHKGVFAFESDGSRYEGTR